MSSESFEIIQLQISSKKCTLFAFSQENHVIVALKCTFVEPRKHMLFPQTIQSIFFPTGNSPPHTLAQGHIYFCLNLWTKPCVLNPHGKRMSLAGWGEVSCKKEIGRFFDPHVLLPKVLVIKRVVQTRLNFRNWVSGWKSFSPPPSREKNAVFSGVVGGGGRKYGFNVNLVLFRVYLKIVFLYFDQ